MPDPTQAARLVAQTYAQAEADLVALLARRSAAGAHSGYDVWAAAKAAEARALRSAVLLRTTELEATVTRLLSEAVASSASSGTAAAGAELVAVGSAAPLVSGTPATVLALAQEATAGVTTSHLGMLRQTMDAYRDVQSLVATRMATGTTTLTQAIDQSLRGFADRGITGFVDSAGRHWGLAEYSEMTTRTAVGRAHTNAKLDGYTAAGEYLVIVSDSPEECPLCRPWEGKVLAIDGRGLGEGSPATDTVSAATSAGLFHPNCAHTANLYVEGLTQPLKGAANPAGYELRQQQRYYERNVRRWNRRNVAATTPEGKDYARRHLKASRARYNTFLGEHDRIPVSWRVVAS